ncbi:Cyclin-T2, partial [Galemys pyrenaicus]
GALPRTRTNGDVSEKGRDIEYGERSGVESRGLGGESAGWEGRGWVRERAEEEVSWRRAVELLLAGSLLGNSWRTRRAAAAEWKRIKSSRTASRRPTSSRTWDSVSISQLTINTAIVYMHRFYMHHSFTKFNRNVSTILFLLPSNFKVNRYTEKCWSVIDFAFG